MLQPNKPEVRPVRHKELGLGLVWNDETNLVKEGYMIGYFASEQFQRGVDPKDLTDSTFLQVLEAFVFAKKPQTLQLATLLLVTPIAPDIKEKLLDGLSEEYLYDFKAYLDRTIKKGLQPLRESK